MGGSPIQVEEGLMVGKQTRPAHTYMYVKCKYLPTSYIILCTYFSIIFIYSYCYCTLICCMYQPTYVHYILK